MRDWINQTEMKQVNAAGVLALILSSGPVTRKQLQERTGLSWGAISQITAGLLTGGYLRESRRTAPAGPGRAPAHLEADPDRCRVIGLDVNCSALRATVTALDGTEIASFTGASAFGNAAQFMEGILDIAERAIRAADGRRVLCMGIAMQGRVDPEKGVSMALPQLADWENVPLQSILQDRFRIPVFLEHDPNCILYARQMRDLSGDAILLRLDHGIGMSVMRDGRAEIGPGMFEIGHVCADPRGPRCSCGRCGCLELYASIRGIEKSEGRPFGEISAAARRGDAAAQRRFHTMAQYLAVAVSNAVQLLNIRRILLCGRLCEDQDLFLEEFMRTVRRISDGRDYEFLVTDVRDAAYGAALYALEKRIRTIPLDEGKDGFYESSRH